MPWVVHAQPADDGARALDYLARYLFRVAISNSRLEQIDRGQVTFRYRNNRTQAIRRVTLSGVEFSPTLRPACLPTPVREGALLQALESDPSIASRAGAPAPAPITRALAVGGVTCGTHAPIDRAASVSPLSHRHADAHRRPSASVQSVPMTRWRAHTSTGHRSIDVLTARDRRSPSGVVRERFYE